MLTLEIKICPKQIEKEKKNTWKILLEKKTNSKQNLIQLIKNLENFSLVSRFSRFLRFLNIRNEIDK